MVSCPECGSKLLYRDGIRYLADGSQTQRWLCRSCGYRFSERQNSNSLSDNRNKRQICAILQEAKNLTSATETKTVAGEIGKQQQDVKGKLLEFAWWLKKKGRADKTIENYTKMLNLLAKEGCNLTDPEDVKDKLARLDKDKGWKFLATCSYTAFLKFLGLSWEAPSYKQTRKLPFIPTEKEIDELIASCGPKTAAFLQLLKETGMRCGEANRLRWIDVDLERRTITLNDPEKNGAARMLRISEKLAGMLGRLPHDSDRVFGNSQLRSKYITFRQSRNIAARKLGNPRLLRIHFHTLRHFKATMEYHKTKDPFHVKELLGHKSVETTALYVQIDKNLFQDQNDEFYSATAKTIEEAAKLIEAGFEYVCTYEGIMLLRKRK